MASEDTRHFSADHLAEDLSAPRRYEGLPSWIMTAFIVLFMAGSIAFRTSGAMRSGNELSVERAVFTSINALTLTGFQQAVGAEQYRPAGHVTVYILTIAGTLLSLIGGGAAVARILRLPFGDRQIITAAVATTVAATILGGAVLSGSYGPFEGVFNAASAFANGGLVVGATPALTSFSTWGVLLPLATAGGIGLTVLMELYTWLIFRRPISHHARIVIAMTAGAFVVGTLLLILTGSDPRAAGALAIDARTAGVPIKGIWPTSNGAKGLLIALMLIGAGSAGTAGGIKLTTVYELCRGTRRTLAGEPPGRGFGIAICFVALFLITLVAGVVALTASAPQLNFESVLMLSVSALANVGLSQDAVSTTGPGLYVLSGLMVAGRLLPFAALWWMANTTRDADVAVG